MVFYYSRGGKTKIFASALGEVTGREVYELESDINKKGGFAFMLKAMSLVFSQKSYPVSNMPNEVPNEIFLCTPIWAGEMSAVARFFLENAELKTTTVHLLLTAGVPVEKYRENALSFLNKIPCKPGHGYIFAATKKVPAEPETIKEQLREILP